MKNKIIYTNTIVGKTVYFIKQEDKSKFNFLDLFEANPPKLPTIYTIYTSEKGEEGDIEWIGCSWGKPIKAFDPINYMEAVYEFDRQVLEIYKKIKEGY